jgi:hypothetical protein
MGLNHQLAFGNQFIESIYIVLFHNGI